MILVLSFPDLVLYSAILHWSVLLSSPSPVSEAHKDEIEKIHHQRRTSPPAKPARSETKMGRQRQGSKHRV